MAILYEFFAVMGKSIVLKTCFPLKSTKCHDTPHKDDFRQQLKCRLRFESLSSPVSGLLVIPCCPFLSRITLC